MQNDRYLAIDEEGYWVFDGRRVEEDALGLELMNNIRIDEFGRCVTTHQGTPAWVEYFDAPLIAKHAKEGSGGRGEIDLPYRGRATFDFSTLSLDEWDRFHGRTLGDNRPFVFSRQAQTEFFDKLEEFDDESITMSGKKYPMPPWIDPSPVAASAGTAKQSRTELGSSVLTEVLPQIKLAKSRVLVVDALDEAAHFASLGHMVTCVISVPEEFGRGQEMQRSYDSLSVLRGDAVKLPDNWQQRFDVVFDNGSFNRIDPRRRAHMVKTWRRLLAPGGHLLGVFLVGEKREGPTWGGSEWEMRERLKSGFDFLYWTRWRRSVEARKGLELVVYARLKG